MNDFQIGKNRLSVGIVVFERERGRESFSGVEMENVNR